MHLPERTANSGVYLLSGQLPIEADIEKKYLTQLMNILRSEGVEKELAWRQLSVKDTKSKSWFMYVSNILSKYNLPSIYDLLENPVSKLKWRETVKSAVSRFWEAEIKKDGMQKSTLKHLSFDNFRIGKPHFIWESASLDTLQVKKAGGEGQPANRNLQVAGYSIKISRGDCKRTVQDVQLGRRKFAAFPFRLQLTY